ncbi:MAG: Ig domain-containing protein [Muribaculaceae bacterium]|nr:Ig domain-containing protein [Muribaculaceae bacterium]
MKSKYILLAVSLLMSASISTKAEDSIPEPTYPTLTGYSISSDVLKVMPDSLCEITLNLLNATPIGRAYQVDMVLPAGVRPVLTVGDSVAIQAMGSTVLDYKYYAADNMMRMLFTNANELKANTKKTGIAKLKLHAETDFEQVGNIEFSNMVFTRVSDEKGYYGTPTSATVTPLIYADSIIMSKDSLRIKVENAVNLTARLVPSAVTTSKVTWKSTKAWVAEVTSTGYVRARSLGEADIIVTTTDGTNLSDTCHVTVIPRIDGLALNMADEITLNVDDEATLAYKVTPTNMSSAVKFSSQNPKVATVDASGLIHAVSAGVTTIAVQTTDGSNLLAMCKVTVGTGDEPLHGDVTSDGRVDVEDVNAVINIILKIAQEEAEAARRLLQLQSADDMLDGNLESVTEDESASKEDKSNY